MSQKVSVIVPVYNAEHNLRRCVESILNQTFADFELLLIDDGSKDRSGKICDEYAKGDRRIKVFHKANGGVSSARNLGLDNACGEWIAFCDADDYVEPMWLSVMFGNVDNCDMVTAGFWIYRNGKKEKLPCIASTSLDRIVPYLEEKGVVGMLWCKLFRASIIKKKDLRFNAQYTICEDAEFIYRFIVESRKIKSIEALVYHYIAPTDFENKYYSKYKISCFVSILNSLDSLFVNYKNANVKNAYANNLLSIFNIVYNDYRVGNYRKGLEDLTEFNEISRRYFIPFSKRRVMGILKVPNIRIQHYLFVIYSSFLRVTRSFVH